MEANNLNWFYKLLNNFMEEKASEGSQVQKWSF